MSLYLSSVIDFIGILFYPVAIDPYAFGAFVGVQ